MPRPSPHSSTEELGNQKKSDSTTVKPIAEPYLLASVNFYRTAIILFQIDWRTNVVKDCVENVNNLTLGSTI